MEEGEDYYLEDYYDPEAEEQQEDLEDEEQQEEDGEEVGEEDGEEDFYGRHDYAVLSEAEVRRRQEGDVSSVCSVIAVPPAWACALLVRYHWDVAKLEDAWFTDEEAVRSDVGLLERGGSGGVVLAPGKKVFKCPICLEKCLRNHVSSAACGHLFCHGCWEIYVHTAIADGPGCLMLRCPVPDCRVSISKDMVERFATEEDGEKYSRYLLRSYVGDGRKLKWCPAPDCQFAVELVGREENFDVRCKCSCYFCWNCGEEAHRPLDCDMVAKWLLKNGSEAESTKWMLAYCKPCPKCHRQIEKNDGCMHMTCTDPCNHHFCWLCLGDWNKHGESTGGFYACNVYNKAKMAGKMDEEDLMKKEAQQSLERYTHYFERWAANHTSSQKALKALAGLDTQVERLVAKYSQPHSQIKFIQEAWLQIAECRRVLKWTYVYGYYLPEEEKRKKRFFEFLQGEAEAQLDILHSCAEKEINVFLDSVDTSLGEFLVYRCKLAGRTSVVRRYFENLVRALEGGLKDVPPGNEDAEASKASVPKIIVDEAMDSVLPDIRLMVEEA